MPTSVELRNQSRGRWLSSRLLLGLLALWLPLLRGPWCAAQTPVSRGEAAAPVSAPASITLGFSAVELVGPWKFQTGDNLGWAAPEFDDASWAEMDLTPPGGSDDPDSGTSDPLPGWSARGYPGYSGYAWYRLRVNVTGVSTRLALKMPDAIDDAYQVYVNGRLIGHLGEFGQRSVTAYNSVPLGITLPKDIRNGPLTIALRVWMDSATRFNSPDAGGLHNPPVLGHVSTIATQVQANWFDTTHLLGSGVLEEFILLMALAVALAHFFFERDDHAYLYLALVSLATLLGNTTVLLVNYSNYVPQNAYLILVDVLAAPLRVGLWVLFWASWFRLGPSRRFQQMVWGLVAFLALGTLLLRPPLFGVLTPVSASHIITPLLLTAKLALAVLLLWKSFNGIRRERLEGWLAVPAVLLTIAANYQREASLIHLPVSFTLLGFTITMSTLNTILCLLLVTVMLSRRFLRAQRRSVEWGVEVERARGIQQLLVPKALPSVAGLAIESEYRPAREVGGDFFQIIPGDTDDDGVLIVVGDVTGKGLSAGMLVALIVGILQTAVRDDPDPVAVLHTLNERLCERTHSSATCLAMRITPNGDVMIANAGHLPPYRNGREIEMEGAFPLGIVPGLQFSIARFKLENRDRLVLISDGVAEAQNSSGELFGFDRVSTMLREPISAAALASAAQQFGQEDDILVLRVERRAGVRVAPHPETTLVFR